MTDERPGFQSQGAAEPSGRQLLQLLQEVEARCPFGPRFFATQLAGLIRDHCPAAEEARPVVEIHLHGGEVLDVCHVIGLAPSFAALAVYAAPPRSTPRPMRTELVPYPSIARVAITGSASSGHHIGFDEQHPALLLATEASPESAEELLRVAATPVG